MNIKIYNKNFDLTEPFRQYLEEKFNGLEKYKENILSFTVELSRDQRHQKGEVFNIEVHVNLPHKQTLLVKETNADPRAAVDLAQEKLTRQLIKFKNKNISKAKRESKNFKSFKFWNRKDKY